MSALRLVRLSANPFMVSFRYQATSVRTAAVEFDYFAVPWDTKIIGRQVAQLEQFRILDAPRAQADFKEFSQWCEEHNVFLCSCRLPHASLAESMFLEEHGFRFIELNYLPEIDGLSAFSLDSEDITVEKATLADREFLADVAGRIYQHGRFHQDARLGAEVGNKRYRAWLLNSFECDTQTVYNCLLAGRTAAFFVVEARGLDHAFWSLVGLVPEFAGRGLAKAVWRAMLAYHRRQGVTRVSTSISSHNIPVLNLYVRLGFRFPAPSMTLHWVRDTDK